MARTPNHDKGDRFGNWTLVDYVDSGGNGEVWIAEDTDGRTGALKILYRFGGDGYDRFIREIEIASRLDSTRLAVLPIWDSDVPEKPSKDSPPWFVMPLATGITTVLEGRSLAEKVGAIQEIAETLAALLEEESLHHRDPKPSNLYSWDGRFVVGDFGLAKRPDDPDLTVEGKVVGPYAYLPSEVFVADGDIDLERVDVSVLGRTLWQFAAQAERPVRGPIVAGGEYSLTRFVDEPLVSSLDGLLASATHETPSQRPTLAEFAQALGDWLATREAGDELRLEVERLDRNTAAVLRWLVGWVRREPGFNSFMFGLDDPTAPTDIPGLSEQDLMEALVELDVQFRIRADFTGHHHLTGLPRYAARLYPTFAGIERVEDDAILLSQGAPLLRALLKPPDLIDLSPHSPTVTVGDVSMPSAEAFFLLRYMQDRGLVHFVEEAGGGGGVLLLNIRVSREGKLSLSS